MTEASRARWVPRRPPSSAARRQCGGPTWGRCEQVGRYEPEPEREPEPEPEPKRPPAACGSSCPDPCVGAASLL